MKFTPVNLIIGLLLVGLLAVGYGLWTRRRKDTTEPAAVLRNIAPDAELTYSSLYPGFTNPKSILQTILGTGGAWVDHAWNDNTLSTFPDWIELTWPQSMVISGITLVGYDNQWPPVAGTGNDSLNALKDYTLQAWVNGAWTTVLSIVNNTKDRTTHTFAAVTTQKLRLNILDTASHEWTRVAQLAVMGRTA